MSRVKRAHRVGGVIQKELSALLLSKIKDPRLELVTITAVKLTDDLRTARIYVSSPQGRERSESVIEGFTSAAGFIRREFGRRLDLKYTPALNFVYDESFDRADKLNRMIRAVSDEANRRDGEIVEE